MLPSAIDEEPVVSIFELLRYWREEPPTHVVLALRYLGERKKAKARSAKEMHEQMRGLGQMVGKGLRGLPEHLREAAEWAEEQAAKLRGKKHPASKV